MARKRTKKEAKARIPRLPTLPPSVVPLLGPAAPIYVAGKSAEIIADAIIDVDPLNRLADSPGQTSMSTIARAVNDPMIMMDAPLMDIINDPSIVMANNGELLRRDTNQFSQIAASLRDTMPKKRKRKSNPKLSEAFKEANARMRTKSGKLRKGKTQADVARLAQRLVKRMK